MPPKRPPCGNPLFLSWVEELREQAREKGSKAFESYSKAARSLSLCPVVYARPRELIVLTGIGAKTIQTLEAKHRAYCQENGLPAPDSPPRKAPAKASSSGTKARKAPRTNALSSDDGGTGSEAEMEPAKKRKKTTGTGTKTAAEKPPKQPKTYIPVKGSGGYGILMGLVLAIERPHLSTQVFLSKTELIRKAQPYSETSYDHSEKGTYYSAWSSMKTLVGKGYVYVTGNPQKYCLTEEGYEVACAIRALLPEHAHMPKHPFIHDPADAIASRTMGPAPTAGRTLGSAPTFMGLDPSLVAPEKRRSSGSKFHFWYIDSAGNRVTSLTAATVRLDSKDYIPLRKLEFCDDQRGHPFAAALKLVERAPPGKGPNGQQTWYGYTEEESAPPMCSKFEQGPPPPASTRPAARPVPAPTASRALAYEVEDDDDWVASPGQMSSTVAGPSKKRVSEIYPSPPRSRLLDELDLAPRTAPGRSELRRSIAVTRTPTLLNENAIAGPSTSASKLPHASSHDNPTHPPNPPRTLTRTPTYLNEAAVAGPSRSATSAPKLPRLSSHVTPLHPLDQVEAPANVGTGGIPNFNIDEALIFPAGSYEVILILDTREVESRDRRDRISEKLADKGVAVETRALRLGDVCWIARRHDGLGGEEDECVLDYVLERKRLDDLVSSLRDGRYTEQCHRLGNSGIGHVWYLVEEWQTAHHMEVSGLQIMTAKSQIQVHNGFFLKETHRLSESIDFLVTMTKVIKSQLERQDLYIIPTQYLSRSTYLPLKRSLKATDPETTFHTSFEAYQDLNDKSASMTLRDKFARMLLCIKGMSPERVSAVLDQFETPRELWEALVRRVREEEEWQRRNGNDMGDEDGLGGVGKPKPKKKDARRGPELFFADRVQGDGRRKIGDALSREMYKIFMGVKI